MSSQNISFTFGLQGLGKKGGKRGWNQGLDKGIKGGKEHLSY